MEVTIGVGIEVATGVGLKVTTGVGVEVATGVGVGVGKTTETGSVISINPVHVPPDWKRPSPHHLPSRIHLHKHRTRVVKVPR